jgi:hypothetical protein
MSHIHHLDTQQGYTKRGQEHLLGDYTSNAFIHGDLTPDNSYVTAQFDF